MNKDTIYREDAIKAVDETPFMRRPILPHYIKAKIWNIPSAEPKQGEWIDRTKLKGFPEYECSVCHAYGQTWMNYCHNCGARMDNTNGKGR